MKPEEIKEAVYHCAPYIGLGKAENAVNVVNEVFAEKGVALPLASAQTVTEESRLADGIAAQKSIFGAHIDAMRAAAPENQKNIQDYLSACCFGDFYTRKFLTIPERELLTFAILAAQGGCEPQVKAYVGGNAAVGNGKATLLDALTVCLPYIGFPPHPQRPRLHQRSPAGELTSHPAPPPAGQNREHGENVENRKNSQSGFVSEWKQT